MNRAELNKAHTKIFESVTEVYGQTGPGLPLAAYRSFLMQEMRLRGLLFRHDMLFQLSYKGFKSVKLTLDFVIENNILIEIITEEVITQLNVASMQTKLKLTGLKMGIIVTFNTLNIIDGYRKVLSNQ